MRAVLVVVSGYKKAPVLCVGQGLSCLMWLRVDLLHHCGDNSCLGLSGLSVSELHISLLVSFNASKGFLEPGHLAFEFSHKIKVAVANHWVSLSVFRCACCLLA